MTITYDSHQNRDPQVRASDADREQVAEVLRHQHVEGRLDSEEMQERIDGCYRAKTVGELDQLLGDLPIKPSPRERFGPTPVRFFRLWPILIGLFVLSAATGHHFFWIAIPLFFLATRFFAPWRGSRRHGRDDGAWA